MTVTAGASFTFPPTWVFPEEVQYHTVITEAESQKKEYFNISGSTPVEQYKIVFSGVSDAGYNGGTGILDHYNGQLGGYQYFTWTSVPSYILGGSDVSGRWVEGSFKQTPRANSWDIEIMFERDLTLET